MEQQVLTPVVGWNLSLTHVFKCKLICFMQSFKSYDYDDDNDIYNDNNNDNNNNVILIIVIIMIIIIITII